MKKKLNLGCGYDYKVGWINLDFHKRPRIDVIYDVRKLPLPFEDNVFDKILCDNLLEHLTFDECYNLLKDLNRILKKGGVLLIKVPFYNSPNNYNTLSHSICFSYTSIYPFTYNSGSDFTLNYVVGYMKERTTTLGKLIPNFHLFTMKINGIKISFRQYLSYYIPNIVDELTFKLIKV